MIWGLDSPLSDTALHYGESANTSNDKHDTTLSSLQFAKQCLETCMSSHKDCLRSPRPGSVYPSRLIELREEQGILKARLTVCDKGFTPTYITLSHRWGDRKFLTLTKTNIEEMKKEIPREHLSKMFLDTFETSWTFGVKYVWIDSLCIIQGCAEDWDVEAARMESVYENAVVNISAASGTSNSQGLFAEDQSAFLKPVTITRSTPPKSDETNEYEVLCCTFWRDEIANAPVNKRAWVLQERLLARRILHFGPTQIAWECSEAGFAQSLSDRDAAMQDYIHFKNLAGHDNLECSEAFAGLGSLVGLVGIAGLGKTPLDNHRVWGQLVEAYTNCDLTRPSDKLVAISGLAKRFGAYLSEKYLAGLWSGYLLQGLLWSVTQTHIKYGQRAREYRAPSWSWASIEGSIRYFPVHGTPQATIEDATTQITTVQNPFGAVKSGYIRIKARAVPILWTRADFNGIVGAKVDLIADVPEDICSVTDNDQYAYPDDIEDIECAKFLYLLLLDKEPPRDDGAYPSVQGIIVDTKTSQTNIFHPEGTFRRVGFFCGRYPSWAYAFKKADECTITIV